ncbi:MAG: hypothetical protein KBE65_01575 [Phycisphaerae bacterium]|nr:hypothetical protein [Phycisphaerae bacterium]
MNAHLSLVAALLMCAASAAQSQNLQADSPGDTPGVTITLLEQRQTGKALQLSYQIANRADHDVWVFAGWGQSGSHATAFLDPEKRALVLTGRLERPVRELRNPALGRYVRLGARRTQVKSITLALRCYLGVTSANDLRQGDVIVGSQMILEIGYYDGDRPAMVEQLFESDCTPAE